MDAAVVTRNADIRGFGNIHGKRASHLARPFRLVARSLCQHGDVLETKFVGLAKHAVHEEAEDAENGVEAHVGGHGPRHKRSGTICLGFDGLNWLAHCAKVNEVSDARRGYFGHCLCSFALFPFKTKARAHTFSWTKGCNLQVWVGCAVRIECLEAFCAGDTGDYLFRGQGYNGLAVHHNFAWQKQCDENDGDDDGEDGVNDGPGSVPFDLLVARDFLSLLPTRRTRMPPIDRSRHFFPQICDFFLKPPLGWFIRAKNEGCVVGFCGLCRPTEF
jgi:hypothetical protein